VGTGLDTQSKDRDNEKVHLTWSCISAMSGVTTRANARRYTAGSA